MRNLKSLAGILLPLTIWLCGCATSNKPAAFKPGVKIIGAQDVQRRALVSARERFTSQEVVAVCVAGYGGRKVTLQVSDTARGVAQTWTESIPPPRLQRTPAGIRFHDYFGELRPMYTEEVREVASDWIIRLSPLPPGDYSVRLNSSDGRQEQGRFTVGAN